MLVLKWIVVKNTPQLAPWVVLILQCANLNVLMNFSEPPLPPPPPLKIYTGLNDWKPW